MNKRIIYLATLFLIIPLYAKAFITFCIPATLGILLIITMWPFWLLEIFGVEVYKIDENINTLMFIGILIDFFLLTLIVVMKNKLSKRPYLYRFKKVLLIFVSIILLLYLLSFILGKLGWC